MLRWALLGLAVVVLIATLLIGALAFGRDRGYFAPVFAPDGQSIYAIRRDVSATIVGFGYEFWTTPAAVWIHRDRFSLVNVRLADRRITSVEEFPPSPLEGTRLNAYHGAIYGVGRGYLRWADPSHLEYFLAVTNTDAPMSRTFVIRRQWSSEKGRWVGSARWTPGYDSMGGNVPEQLSGDREVIALRGDELLPCAVVILREGEDAASPVIETDKCRQKYASGYARAAMAEFIRRPEIERVQRMERTYADLVARGRAEGLNEGTAMLRANKEMERLGYYPKSPTIVAHREACGTPVFHISDEEFKVGLFQDIEQAIAHPDQEVDKGGEYVIHQQYDTSRQLNAFLKGARNAVFYVEGRGGCWRMTVTHYQ
jgi:hypothetical protein